MASGGYDVELVEELSNGFLLHRLHELAKICNANAVWACFM